MLAGSQVPALSTWHMSPLLCLPGGRAAAMQRAASGHAAAHLPSCKWAATFHGASTSESKMSSADCSQRLNYKPVDACVQAVATDFIPDLTPVLLFCASDFFNFWFHPCFLFLISPDFTCIILFFPASTPICYPNVTRYFTLLLRQQLITIYNCSLKSCKLRCSDFLHVYFLEVLWRVQS